MPPIATHVHGHGHAVTGVSLADAVLAAPFVIAVVLYACAALTKSRGGRPWPWLRIGAWTAGVALVWLGVVGPLAAAAHGDVVAHMGAHLLVGMVAPLLLVLAAPVTLALRSFSIEPARRVSAVLRSPVGRLLTHPVFAAVLNVGGLAVLYLSPMLQTVHENPLLHVLVMMHFLVAGFLYTASLVAVDPNPHRSGIALRAVVLVLSLAAHSIIAKLLYAHPPAGLPVDEVQEGAQLMFYGGDLVDLTLLVLLGAEWYRVTGRRLARSRVSSPRQAATVGATGVRP
ncbi:cytochrome c oxidase assembly protein [Microbacterium sp. 179-I 3D4 NHS]|uniref:cytochrome c oxidase assembly protein n=1 Tax=Microbacterium sp. 179-I 3D4 NHS TaxID=3142381 RepID=UPI0039A00C0A